MSEPIVTLNAVITLGHADTLVVKTVSLADLVIEPVRTVEFTEIVGEPLTASFISISHVLFSQLQPSIDCAAWAGTAAAEARRENAASFFNVFILDLLYSHNKYYDKYLIALGIGGVAIYNGNCLR